MRTRGFDARIRRGDDLDVLQNIPIALPRYHFTGKRARHVKRPVGNAITKMAQSLNGHVCHATGLAPDRTARRALFGGILNVEETARLTIPITRIKTALGQQSIMRANLDDLTLIHDNDAVHIGDGA